MNLPLQITFIWKEDKLLQVDLKEGASHLEVVGSTYAKDLTHHWLENYLEGNHLPLPIHNVGSPFQTQVLTEMAKIPFATTISYSELANRLGNAKAVRAVGSACGKNPCPLVIPCHRVIAKDNSLGGFSLGLPIKRTLLSLEEKVAK